ncbi:hypothetical protein [Williamsia sterculiae]|nr:hypothetical protein [Williamsia sterculiae]
MDSLLDFAAHYWWLIFVFGGSAGGLAKGIAAANERRAERRQERYRLKQQAKIAAAEANGRARTDAATERRSVTKALDEHEQTDARWFDYELNILTLIETPMMTDLREPLTLAFHRAKRHADLLKPDTADALVGDPDKQREYREAVHDYAVAFDVAEVEAKRRRQSDFNPIEQQRLARAQHLLTLAMDSAASSQERQSAYTKARKELDGLLVVPTPARVEVERRIAGQLES